MAETVSPLDDVEPLSSTRSTGLLVGFGLAAVDELRGALGDGLELLVVSDAEEAGRLVASRRVAVLCLGPELPPDEGVALLERVVGSEASPTVNLVLAAGEDPGLFRPLLDQDAIFFLTREPPTVPEQVSLLRRAAKTFETRWREHEERAEEGVEYRLRSRTVIENLNRLALQEEPADMAELLAEAAQEVGAADRAACLLHDTSDETLWARDPITGGERRANASLGLVGFVLRSGLAVRVERMADDPRWDQRADDPRGEGEDRFLAVPLETPEGESFGVLTMVRGDEDDPFSEAEVRIVERLALMAAGHFKDHFLSPVAVRQAETAPAEGQAVFRQAAVERWMGESEEHGDPLRISPAWIRRSYRALLLLSAAAIVFLLLVEVDEYATGAAVVRSGGRIDLMAPMAASVATVEVVPGQRVEAGQRLVQFRALREAAELERIEQELTLQLVRRLYDPSDIGTESALFSLRTQWEVAQSRVEELSLRAPVDGRVGDLWVREGQYLLPGQNVLTLAGAETRPELVILVPGEFRPQLEPGMKMRLEIVGYQHFYQQLEIRTVSDEVVAAAEALRFLGPELSGGIELVGPVALVEADLPSESFEVRGNEYLYHEGMFGTAQIRVRSEKAIFTLLPGLRAIFNDG